MLNARVEGLFFNMDFRIDIRYRAVQVEARVALVRPCNAEAAKCHSLWQTLFGLLNVTLELLHELGADVLLDKSRHGVRVFFG